MCFLFSSNCSSHRFYQWFFDFKKSQRSTDFHVRPGSCQFLHTSVHDSQTALCAYIAALLFASFFKGRVRVVRWRKGLPFPCVADGTVGCVDCFGESHFVFVGNTLPPFLKSIPDNTKYRSVCLLVVRSKVARVLNYLERERN